MKWGKAKEAEIFKQLAYKSTAEVGLEYNFDKVYPTKVAIRNAVCAIRTKVKTHPDNYTEFGITPEVQDLVTAAAETRNVAPAHKRQALKQLEIDLDPKMVLGKILGKTLALVDRKLDIVTKSRKKLEATSFKELGVIAGIAFDKRQILLGEATQNIAVMAKIDINVSPEEALRMVSEMREVNSQNNDLRKK